MHVPPVFTTINPARFMRALRGRMPCYAGLMAGLTLLCWLAGFAAFASHISNIPALSAKAPRTDLIVVLTGGAGRVRLGIELMAAGHAPHVFMTGVNEQVDIPSIIALANGAINGMSDQDATDLVTCCVTLGHQAHNTRQNAEEARKWISGTGDIHSITVVTSSYHMPRTILEFRQKLTGIKIIPAPVTYGSAPAHDRRHFWFLAFSEYNKTLLSWIRVTLTPNKALHTP